MVKVVAPTLEEAYKKASQAFDCSIVELDIEVVQAPSSGLFGLFRKDAVINVTHKRRKEKEAHPGTEKRERSGTSAGEEALENARREIEEGVVKLIESSCFDAYVKQVDMDNEGVVHICLDGEDAALMIGKEGYRYKALSYMLHNWIKLKYGLNSTLEIASFLQSQRKGVENYLEQFSQRVEEGGRVQTKPLDGILVKLALEGLRKRYPDKYVAIRTLKNGRKVIVVNEHKKEQGKKEER
ncbi:MAG TPA: protein jag [Campylobacteraceae bacterium]|nr:protein jag [Campylobacteraceae bacterium]